MKTFRTLVTSTLIVLLGLASTASAQERHVVPSTTIGQAVTAQTTQDQANRDAVKATLAREEVRAIAARAGVDLTRASAAVDTFTPDQLAQAAAAAKHVDESLVGGASTVTISTTTIIIALLILIIVLVAD